MSQAPFLEVQRFGCSSLDDMLHDVHFGDIEGIDGKQASARGGDLREQPICGHPIICNFDFRK